jgi:hypothetical protein
MENYLRMTDRKNNGVKSILVPPPGPFGPLRDVMPKVIVWLKTRGCG